MKPDLLKIREACFRVRPWKESSDIAYLALLTPVDTMPTPVLVQLFSLLAERGYNSVVTAPVNSPERDRLLNIGFHVREELFALCHSLESLPPYPPTQHEIRIHAGRHQDLTQVLKLDTATFDPFWSFDATGFHEARTATPISLWRVIRHQPYNGHVVRLRPSENKIVGYCVTGRAGNDGYLQRMAIAKTSQGCGFGTRLVIDALWWLHRHGVTNALVNTQIDNKRALALYEHCGFVLEPTRLAVLCSDLT